MERKKIGVLLSQLILVGAAVAGWEMADVSAHIERLAAPFFCRPDPGMLETYCNGYWLPLQLLVRSLPYVLGVLAALATAIALLPPPEKRSGA